MFYSQTFLARKGPLGTVWCAAHLQHRLKKSHYTSTNISATVDLIMFLNVPLALRMSGHLLLGVVRIYSKKVDYLFQDCNVVLMGLRKVFTSVEVNLPEDARQAPVESVTLPETLTLDSFNFDNDTLDMDMDNHLRSQEDITLTDQIPTDTDPFVAVTFDEDIFPDARQMDVDGPSTMPINDDPNNETEEANFTQPVQDLEPNTHPQVSNMAMDAQVPGASNQTEELDSPPVEKMRDAFHELSHGSHIPFALEQSDAIFEETTGNARSSQNSPAKNESRCDAVPDISPGSRPPFSPGQPNATLEELTGRTDQNLDENENRTPVLEDMLNSGGNPSFKVQSSPPASRASEEGPGNFGHSPLNLAIQPTPPVQQQQQPERRPRKRKLFDRATVLTNRVMKQRLEDPSDILRKKRNLPSSALRIWKFNNCSRKEQMFHEPLISGFPDDLYNIFKRDYITSKPHLTAVEAASAESTGAISPTREAEDIPETGAAQSPHPATEATPDDKVALSPREITATPEVVQSPNPPTEPNSDDRVAQSSHLSGNDDWGFEHLRDDGSHGFMHSSPGFSQRGVDFTPLVGTAGTETTTTSFTASAQCETDPQTPRTNPEDFPDLGNSGLPKIPELDEELAFLEAGSETPARSEASQGGDALSVRTRGLAQYLKERSASPTSGVPSEELSMSKILEGKTRKLAARMFFETLVLKTNGLIDVQQDQLYGDITLKLTPSLLSKAQL